MSSYFISLLGGAASTWPMAAWGQQSATPVIGFLNGVSFEGYAEQVAAIQSGLRDTGFVEGRNLSIEYRSADGFADRLPNLAAELVALKVSLIIAIAAARPAQAAKAATSTIPIVFAMGGDALESGLVNSLNRPGANVTGMSFATSQLAPKRLGLLRELMPTATSVGYLVNSRLSPSTIPTSRELEAAAATIGRKITILDASTEAEISVAFERIAQLRIEALIVSPDAFLNTRRDKVVGLAAQYAISAIYSLRSFVLRGGLISYGAVTGEMYRQAGVYAGRILKGEKAAELPVQQPTKFEMVINLKTAKALGLEVPPMLLARTDEVID